MKSMSFHFSGTFLDSQQKEFIVYGNYWIDGDEVIHSAHHNYCIGEVHYRYKDPGTGEIINSGLIAELKIIQNTWGIGRFINDGKEWHPLSGEPFDTILFLVKSDYESHT